MLRIAIWYLVVAALALLFWYPYGRTAKRADQEAEELLTELVHI